MLANNWYKTLVKGVGRWLQKTTVVKTTLENLRLVRCQVAEQAARTGRGGLPTAALLEAPVPFVLSGGWPLGLVSERAERTAHTPPEPCDQHRVARRRRAGRGEQLVRGNELKGDKKRVCIVNF